MRESSTITSCGTGLDAIAAGDEAVEPSYRIDLPRESAAVERVLPVDTGTGYCNVEPVFGGLWARNVSIGGRAVADRKRGNEIVLSDTTH